MEFVRRADTRGSKATYCFAWEFNVLIHEARHNEIVA